MSDDDAQESEEVLLRDPNARNFISWLLGRGAGLGQGSRPERRVDPLARFPKYDEQQVQAMVGDLAESLNWQTRAVNKRRRCDAPRLDVGIDPCTDQLVTPCLLVASQPNCMHDPNRARDLLCDTLVSLGLTTSTPCSLTAQPKPAQPAKDDAAETAPSSSICPSPSTCPYPSGSSSPMLAGEGGVWSDRIAEDVAPAGPMAGEEQQGEEQQGEEQQGEEQQGIEQQERGQLREPGGAKHQMNCAGTPMTLACKDGAPLLEAQPAHMVGAGETQGGQAQQQQQQQQQCCDSSAPQPSTGVQNTSLGREPAAANTASPVVFGPSLRVEPVSQSESSSDSGAVSGDVDTGSSTGTSSGSDSPSGRRLVEASPGSSSSEDSDRLMVEAGSSSSYETMDESEGADNRNPADSSDSDHAVANRDGNSDSGDDDADDDDDDDEMDDADSDSSDAQPRVWTRSRRPSDGPRPLSITLPAGPAGDAREPERTGSATRALLLQQRQHQQPRLNGEGEAGTGAAASSRRASGSSESKPLSSGCVQVNSLALLLKRETGLGDPGCSGFSRSQRQHLTVLPSGLPTTPCRLMDSMDSRAYIGQFSRDGAFFVVGYQDQRVRLYDVEEGWKLRKDVRARGIRWTITDTCVSPDQRYLLYASINPTVHLVAVGSGGSDNVVESVANITEVHEALDFDPSRHTFGIWSVRWSGDGREIIAGTNNRSVYIYDLGESKVVARVAGHADDVNAVEYLDSSPNIIVSGSDDAFIKVWDRRTLDSGNRRRARAVGVLVGHLEGLTHLNSRGDGRHFISNSKDQSVKMWDIRLGLRSEAEAAALPEGGVPTFNWDYRMMAYPAAGRHIHHPYDASIMTYKGHSVRQTLIRAYFSPAHTTGQSLIYSGSADNNIHIWSAVTGRHQATLSHHCSLVRDVSWHPTKPMIASVSWDGSVVAWGTTRDAGRLFGGSALPPRQRMQDRMGGW